MLPTFPLLAHLLVQVAVFILGKGLPVQQQLPPSGLVQILQQGNHRALPRPIGPNQRRHFARAQGEGQPLESRESHNKRHTDAPNLEPVIVLLHSMVSYPREERRKMEKYSNSQPPTRTDFCSSGTIPPQGVEMRQRLSPTVPHI